MATNYPFSATPDAAAALHTTNSSDSKRKAEETPDAEEEWKYFTTFKIKDFDDINDDTRLYHNPSLYGATHYIYLDSQADLFDNEEWLRFIAIIEKRQLQIQFNLDIDIGPLPPPESTFGRLLRGHPQVTILKLVDEEHENEEWEIQRYNNTMEQIFSIASSSPENPGYLKTIIIKGPISDKLCKVALGAFIRKNAASLQHFQLLPRLGLQSDLELVPSLGVPDFISGVPDKVNVFPPFFSEALLSCPNLNTLALITKNSPFTNYTYIQQLDKVLMGSKKLKSLAMGGSLCGDAELIFAVLNSTLEVLDLSKLERVDTAFNNPEFIPGLGRHASLRSLALPRGLSPADMQRFMESRISNTTSRLWELQITHDSDYHEEQDEVIEQYSICTMGIKHGLPFHILSIHFHSRDPRPVMPSILSIMSTSSYLQTLSLRRDLRVYGCYDSFVPNDEEAKCLAECLQENLAKNKNLIRLDLGINSFMRMSPSAKNILEGAIKKNPALQYLTPLRGETTESNVQFIPLKPPVLSPRLMAPHQVMYDHIKGNRWRPLIAMLAGRISTNSRSAIWNWFHHKQYDRLLLKMIFSDLPGRPQLKTLPSVRTTHLTEPQTARSSSVSVSLPTPTNLAARSSASSLADMRATSSFSSSESRFEPLTAAFDDFRKRNVATSSGSSSVSATSVQPAPAVLEPTARELTQSELVADSDPKDSEISVVKKKVRAS